MIKYEILIKYTYELDEEEIIKIINLKQQNWNYDFNSQFKWFKNNIKDTDTHIWISDSESIIAYLNLVDVKVIIDGYTNAMLGIGNVCVSQVMKNCGFGRAIVNIASRVIMNSKKGGILLCKEDLQEFYSKEKWTNFQYNESYIQNKKYNHKIMFLYPNSIVNDKKKCNKIEIDRNF